jgi:hypothetical protein
MLHTIKKTIMEDLDHAWPAILQLRQINDVKRWMCTPYNPPKEQIALFYTPLLGEQYPFTKPLYLLEKITRGPIIQIPLFWIPLWLTLLYNTSPISLPLFFSGIFAWSFSEYWIHRGVFHNNFCFHYLPEVVFTTHFVHHKQPNDYSRLCAPLILSLPIATLLFWGTYNFLFPQDLHKTCSFMCGFVLGYICYDIMHFLTHYTKPFLTMQYHHLAHHGLCHKKYGFTSKLWDWIFGSE